MKKITIFLLFLPALVFAQWGDCGFGNGYLCPKPYDIDLDTDTTYVFQLKKDYCYKDFYGQPSEITVLFEKNYSLGIAVNHQFSVNCCTDEIYFIKIENDTINISYTSEGDICTCGSCTYEVRFNDPEPSKSQYRVVVKNLIDTLVSIESSNIEISDLKKSTRIEYSANEIKVDYNGIFNQFIDASLYDIRGNILYNERIRKKEFFMSLPVNRGVYILRIWNGTNLETTKLIL